ncbi:MAG TPA: hypothetical protein VF875_03925 [Anaeromyxobacter sp.]
MLTTLAAFQLLLLSQVTPPTLVGPDDASAADPSAADPSAESISAEAAPEAPPAAPAPPATPGAAAPPAPPATPAAAAPPATKASTPTPASPPLPSLPSLQSAEPLRGATAVFAWGGWSSIGVAYVMGVTPVDDLGAVLDLDWSKTELRLGGIYRRPFGMAGAWDVAGRVGLYWYAGLGNDWIYEGNHADRGVQLEPAVVLSRRAGTGIFSVAVEAPMTVTTRYDSGFLFAPRLAGSYELGLLDGVTVGARVGIGYRAGAGDAPLHEGRGELQFLVLASWQLL